MLYAIIPLLIAIFFIGLIKLYLPTKAAVRPYKGHLSNLPLICSVLSSADIGRRYFSCSVWRRVTRLDVRFFPNSIQVELPLITASQRKFREGLLKHFDAFEGVVISSSLDGKEDRIIGTWKRPLDELAAEIEQLFINVFECPKDADITYEISAHWTDTDVISKWWDQSADKVRAEQPTGGGFTKDTMLEKQRGCFSSILSVLLYPIPFVLAFYLADFRTAAAVHLLVSAGELVSGVYRKGFGAFAGPFSLLKVLVPAGAALAAFSSQAFFLQLIPSAACIVLGLYAIISVITGRPIFPDKKEDKNSLKFTGVDELAIAVGMLLVAGLGYMVSEHLRAASSVETWVWYFAYFRLELMLGMMLVGLPVILNRTFNTFSK